MPLSPTGSSTGTDSAYRRLALDLRTQIHEGRFGADEALPTEAQLASRYDVSRQTVRRAFQDLVAEGLVFRIPGRGSFVTPESSRYLRQLGSVEELMSLSADSDMRIVAPLADTVDLAAASRLRLPDDRLSTVAFVRVHNRVEFCHTRVYVPPAVRDALGEAPELTTAGMVSRTTVIAMLDRALPVPIRDADQSVTVAPAPLEAAEALGVAPDALLLRIDRTYIDAGSQPVELAISYFRPDRYSYRIRLRRSPG
jgi:GntR family transcriptional regulator